MTRRIFVLLIALLLSMDVDAQIFISTSVDAYMMATNRVLLPTATQTVISTTQFEAGRLGFTSAPYDQTDLRVCFPNFYVPVSGETATGNSLLLQAVAVELSGVVTQLKFSGGNSVTIASGSFACSDAGGPAVPANSNVRIRWADQLSIGDLRATSGYIAWGALGDGVIRSASDQSALVTDPAWNPNNSQASMSGPSLIVAKGWLAAGRPPVPLIVGDSIGQWQQEETGFVSTRGALGWIGRGMDDNASSTAYPYAVYAIPGTGLTNLANSAGNFAIRYSMLQTFNWPFTTVISNMGHNSAGNANSQITDAATFLKTMGSKWLVWTTLTPNTTSTDNFTTVGNQTLGPQDAGTVQFNTFLLTTPSPINAVLDVRSYFMDTLVDRKWKSPGYSTTLNTAMGSTGLSTMILDTGSAPPNVDAFLVIEPGLANEETVKVASFTGTGPYTVTFPLGRVNAKTHLAGVAVAEQFTQDGTHPTTRMDLAAMAGIIAAKNAGAIH